MALLRGPLGAGPEGAVHGDAPPGQRGGERKQRAPGDALTRSTELGLAMP